MAKATGVIGFISREDYAEYRSVCVDGDTMPGDYKAFLKNYNEQVSAMRASGVSPTQMNIKPSDLVAWCRANKHQIDSDGRTAYANFKFAALNFVRR